MLITSLCPTWKLSPHTSNSGECLLKPLHILHTETETPLLQRKFYPNDKIRGKILNITFLWVPLEIPVLLTYVCMYVYIPSLQDETSLSVCGLQLSTVNQQIIQTLSILTGAFASVDDYLNILTTGTKYNPHNK